jgi:UDPglucose 6-dehydrogenase
MKIVVVGVGYVGLVTGTCLAEIGNNVTCVDIDKYKVENLNAGQITIYEPGLEKIFISNIKCGRLKFTTQLEDAVDDAEIIFLALPTPPGADGSADLKYVLSVADHLGKIINGYKVIVNKSTVPVGTANKVRAAIEANYKSDFDVVSNPEFLREGVAVNDFMKPDRIVIGSRSSRAKKIMSDLYEPFVGQKNPLIFMDERSSELTKYAANSFLATKISFMNEIAQLCELMEADVDMVRIGIGSDGRIGENFLFPGIGYGGSCFPKDVQALIIASDEVEYNFQILKAVKKVNTKQKLHLIQKIKLYYNNHLQGKHFALWGLSFKPNTDDVREAPSFVIIEALTELGATITAYDPEAMSNVKSQIGNKINFADDQYLALAGAEALIIATEWSEFTSPDFERMERVIKCKIIFDGRNIYDPKEMNALGYHYESIGR